MGRKSSVKLLPDAVRGAIDGMIADGRATLDDVVAYVEARGFTVSRTAVWRYAQNFNEVAQKLRRSREMAQALVQEIGPDLVEGKSGRMLVEILQSIVFEHLLARTEGDAGAQDPEQIFLLARAIKDMAAAQKIDADRELRIREATAKAAATRAESAIKEQGEKHGFKLPAEALRAIREQIYGIVERA